MYFVYKMFKFSGFSQRGILGNLGNVIKNKHNAELRKTAPGAISVDQFSKC